MRIARSGLVAATAVGMFVAGSGAAYAHECVNISKKNQSAGVQVVIDANTDEVVWASRGVLKRAEAGLIDFDTGEGFSGLIGLDFDGDGVADVATFIVGPNGEIAEQAQWNGAECSGVVNFEALFSCPNSPLAP